MNPYGTWGRFLHSTSDLEWPAVDPHALDSELQELKLVRVDNLEVCDWEVLHTAQDIGTQNVLRVRRLDESIFFEWRDIKVLWENATIHYEGRGVEAFVDRVVFPVVESVNPDSITLHGAAVAGARATLILGRSGVGKSTLAHSLSSRGRKFWADDVLAIEDKKLKPSASSSRIRGATPETEDFPGSGKRRILQTPFFHSIPISSVVVLKRGPELTLTNIDNVIPLMPYLFDLDPGDPELRKARFHHLSTLVRSVPVYEMTFPSSADGRPSARQFELIEKLIS